ncbi:MAG: NnrU family protein [Hyphomicrobium sp.]|nr:MAG: NnrU family protein [Hyphomicrobium sp.]
MLLLFVGLAVFFAIHAVPTQPDLRTGLVNRFGETTYKSLFAVLSISGLALIVFGYGKLQGTPGKNPDIWFPPAWTRPIAMLVMLPAMVFLVAANVPSRIRDGVKHPMLLGVILWALAHLLVNGDLASVILFGSFFAWAAVDLMSVRRRQALGPLGSRKGGPIVNDIIVVGAGVGLYVLFISWAHKILIGVSIFG